MMHVTLRYAVRTLLAAMLVVGGVGCFDAHEVHVSDDLNFELFQSNLHTPYVVGAPVHISVYGDGNNANEAGWTAESTHPGVFEISSVSHNGDGMSLDCSAVAEGETQLLIRDAKGGLKASRLIRVLQPDRVVLVPAGHIKVIGDGAEGVDLSENVSIRVGGTATFEVIYFQGDERLFGNGALLATPSDLTLEALPRTSYIFENREWLSLTPDATGVTSVELSVGGQVLGTVNVLGVEESAIHQVRVQAEATSGADDGDLFHLVARAFDASEGEIFGVTFDWTVDGVAQDGDGDMFTYTYAEDSEVEVAALANGEVDAVYVSMSGGSVASSNTIGCSTAGPGAALPSLLLPLLVLGLLAIRRRLA